MDTRVYFWAISELTRSAPRGHGLCGATGPGATDLRWLQMEDLGHVSKADVKRAINECEKALMANAKKALGTHQSADS